MISSYVLISSGCQLTKFGLYDIGIYSTYNWHVYTCLREMQPNKKKLLRVFLFGCISERTKFLSVLLLGLVSKGLISVCVTGFICAFVACFRKQLNVTGVKVHKTCTCLNKRLWNIFSPKLIATTVTSKGSKLPCIYAKCACTLGSPNWHLYEGLFGKGGQEKMPSSNAAFLSLC